MSCLFSIAPSLFPGALGGMGLAKMPFWTIALYPSMKAPATSPLAPVFPSYSKLPFFSFIPSSSLMGLAAHSWPISSCICTSSLMMWALHMEWTILASLK